MNRDRKKAEQFIKTQFGVLEERLKKYRAGEFESESRRFYDNTLDRLNEAKFWAEKAVCKSAGFN